jgi:hypothetical protein
MFCRGIFHAELDNFPDAEECLIDSLSVRVATFELGAGYDEDSILISLDHDGNMDRFHTHIIGIHALILFCPAFSRGMLHAIGQDASIGQTVSGQFVHGFTLSWSHYAFLLNISKRTSAGFMISSPDKTNGL